MFLFVKRDDNISIDRRPELENKTNMNIKTGACLSRLGSRQRNPRIIAKTNDGQNVRMKIFLGVSIITFLFHDLTSY